MISRIPSMSFLEQQIYPFPLLLSKLERKAKKMILFSLSSKAARLLKSLKEFSLIFLISRITKMKKRSILNFLSSSLNMISLKVSPIK
jgi:hypothetical protein